MIIENAVYSEEHFNENDLFIFAIGYEHRSYYLYDRVVSKLPAINTTIFAFDDFEKYEHTRNKIDQLEKCGLIITKVGYAKSRSVQKIIIDRVINLIAQSESITVHIDYSSMPRSWYCKLPILFQNLLRENDRIYFWYSEGEYPASYEEYPSAGIDDFSFFSGKPSLQIDNNRVHVIALGFDAIRTEAIISITDPDYLIVCYAYNPKRENFPSCIKKVNHQILTRAAISLALRLDDFSFMISKLRDTANELLPTGDVILIPDGPKPLIFAISLVPDLLNKNGVTCLHVSRNSSHFEPVDVTSTGVIYGFSIKMG